LNVFDFFERAAGKDDAVGLEALSITTSEFALRVPILIDQETPQAKSGRTALAKAVFNVTALPRKYLDRKLAAVFAGHDPLYVLEEDRTDAAIIVKLLGTIVNSDPCPRANVLVISTFIGILKPSPAADVVD
jgi:hypothetical protein